MRYEMMKTLIAALLTAAVLLLAGCAQSPWGGKVSGGGASYRYVKTADGAITVEITTSREIQGGDISVNPDGSLTATAKQAQGMTNTVDLLQSLVDRLPGVP